MSNQDIDIIGIENSVVDDIEQFGQDVIDADIDAIVKERVIEEKRKAELKRQKEEERRLRAEKKKIASEIRRKTRKVTDEEGLHAVNFIVATYQFLQSHDNDALHWTARLSRILSAIDYRPDNYAILASVANKEFPTAKDGTLEVPIAELVKNHLSATTFENITHKLDDYMMRKGKTRILERIAAIDATLKEEEVKQAQIIRAEALDDPEWGMF